MSPVCLISGVLAATAAASPAPDYRLWAILCIGIAVILFFIELFVPSGGLLGLSAASALVVGIVLLFKTDTTLGLVSAIISLLAVPFVLALAIRVVPSTPIARLLLLRTSQKAERIRSAPRPLDAEDEDGEPSDSSADSATQPPAPDAGSALLGQTGKALTDLRPVGTCLIAGQRLDGLAESGIIRAGSAVRVVSVDGMQVKVRAEE